MSTERQKYVIFSDGTKEYVVVFDRELGHVDVAKGVARFVVGGRGKWSHTHGPLEAVSAGFVGDAQTGSESLGLGPRPQDAAMLKAREASHV